MAKNRKNLSEFVSGSFDGQLILWNISDKSAIFNINSNHNFVKGLTYSNDGNSFLSCGDDNKINLWNKATLFAQKNTAKTNNFEGAINYSPSNVYQADDFLESIDNCYHDPVFATAGSVVALWNYERNSPIHQYKTSTDGYIKVKFNVVERNIVLATGYDRSVNIFDIRTQNPLKSVTLKNKSSAACWNPHEPFNFTLGNEDSNCYTFDMRNLDVIKMIHKDHILAV